MDTLATLDGLINLETLELENMAITPQMFSQLSSLRNLRLKDCKMKASNNTQTQSSKHTFTLDLPNLEHLEFIIYDESRFNDNLAISLSKIKKA